MSSNAEPLVKSVESRLRELDISYTILKQNICILEIITFDIQISRDQQYQGMIHEKSVCRENKLQLWIGPMILYASILTRN